MPSSCKEGRLISNFRMKWTRCYTFTINTTLRTEVGPWRDHWICCQVTKRPRSWNWIFKSTSCKWKVRLRTIYPYYVQPFPVGPCHSRKFRAPGCPFFVVLQITVDKKDVLRKNVREAPPPFCNPHKYYHVLDDALSLFFYACVWVRPLINILYKRNCLLHINSSF